jgi:heme oxygenase
MKHTASAEFDDFVWGRLQEEAARQEVTVDQLVAHAAIYYLGDLDSGRIATRVLRMEEDDSESAGPPADG